MDNVSLMQANDTAQLITGLALHVVVVHDLALYSYHLREVPRGTNRPTSSLPPRFRILFVCFVLNMCQDIGPNPLPPIRLRAYMSMHQATNTMPQNKRLLTVPLYFCG
jgi:hypothetical protein